MEQRGPVLIVDDSCETLPSLKTVFYKTGYQAEVVKSGKDAMAWLRTHKKPPCAILVEARMTATGAKKFFEELKGEFPKLFSSLLVIFSRKH